EHTDAELEEILAKAEKTYENDWSLRSLPERKAVVKRAASILRDKIDEFAEPITLEMGKLFREAQGEVELSADILDYYADNAEKFLAPEKLDVVEGEAFIENSPLGVLFCIEPWNFPYYQLARVAGPNLMAGNMCRSARWRLKSFFEMLARRWVFIQMFLSRTSNLLPRSRIN